MENEPGKSPTGGQTANQTAEEMIAKSKVNELMQKRVQRSHQAFFNRYGVKNLEELDALVGKAQSYEPMKSSYDDLNTRFSDLTTQHSDLTKKYAYKSANINPDKFNDIETYFKGKNLDITEETLNNEVKTHPDWVNKVSGIIPIGQEDVQTEGADTEAQLASRIFGVDLTN